MRVPMWLLAAVAGIGLSALIVLVPVRSRATPQIVAVALSKTGRIAAGTASGRITIWEASTVHETSVEGPLNDIQFSPDERFLAVGTRKLILLSTNDLAAQILRADNRNYGTVRFSSDGASILIVTGAATIEVIDIASGAARATICCSTIYGEVAFAPDGSSIVNAGHWPSVWNLSGQLIARLADERAIETLRPIAFAEPDRVLIGSQDGRIYVWSLQTHKLVARSPAQPGYVDTVATVNHGWIAYAAWGNSLRMWNIDTGEQRILKSAFPTSNVIAAPGKDAVLFGTSSGTVEFRSIENGELLRKVDFK